MNNELGDRAALIVVTVAWREVVDFNWGWLKDLVRVKTRRDDDSYRDAVVGISLDARSS